MITHTHTHTHTHTQQVYIYSSELQEAITVNFSTICGQSEMRREINPRIKSFALIVTVVGLAWVSKYGFGSGISVAIKTIR
jgi:hypothetical protein